MVCLCGMVGRLELGWAGKWRNPSPSSPVLKTGHVRTPRRLGKETGHVLTPRRSGQETGNVLTPRRSGQEAGLVLTPRRSGQEIKEGTKVR